MQKRGQVSIFVIVGIVLVILVMLLWYLNDQGIVPITGSGSSITTKVDSIKNEVQRCSEQGVREGLNVFGKQGGEFTPLSYVRYYSMNVPYYCTFIPKSEKCLNIMPLLENIRLDFERYVNNYMKNCVSADIVKSSNGVDVKTGEMKVNVEFDDNVVVNVNYDVRVSKEGSAMALDRLRISVADTPVKELYNIAYDIIQAKTMGYEFDQNVYMIKKYGLYEINVDKPYPDIIYKINKKDSKFELWFAVEGKEEWIA